jgi:hypothetical protein
MTTPDEIKQTLFNWQGSGAEIWSYSTSHSRLVIRLRNQEKQLLYIIMEDVYGIFGVVAWPNADIAATYDDIRREWVVRDARVGFVVPCGAVQLADAEPSW